MESINGLPAHPLFVHAPVVLLPLATLAMLILAVRPQLRRRAGFALAAAVVAVFATTQLAIMTGEAFDAYLDGAVDADDHAALGEMTRNFILVFLGAVFMFAILDWRSGAESPKWVRPLTWAFVVLAVVSSVLGTIWMVRTGEDGARLVWKNTFSLVTPLLPR